MKSAFVKSAVPFGFDFEYNKGTYSEYTQPRTPRISGLKSQVWKPKFWLQNENEV